MTASKMVKRGPRPGDNTAAQRAQADRDVEGNRKHIAFDLAKIGDPASFKLAAGKYYIEAAAQTANGETKGVFVDVSTDELIEQLIIIKGHCCPVN